MAAAVEAVNVEATPTDLPTIEPLENNDNDTLNQKKVRFVTHDKPAAPSSTAKLSKQQAGSKRKGATNQKEKGPSAPPSKELEEDEAFEVEAILAHRKRQKCKEMEFLLKWKGYPESENSWEPMGNLSCSDLLKPYMTKHKLASSSNATSDREPVKSVDNRCNVSSKQSKPKRSGSKKSKLSVNNKLPRSRDILLKAKREVRAKNIRTTNTKAADNKAIPKGRTPVIDPETKNSGKTSSVPGRKVCTQAQATPASVSTFSVREEYPRQYVAGLSAGMAAITDSAKEDDDVVLLYVDPPRIQYSRTQPVAARSKCFLSPTDAYFSALGNRRTSMMAASTRIPSPPVQLSHPPTKLPTPPKEGSVVLADPLAVATPCVSPVINSPISENSFNLRLSPSSTVSSSSGESESPCVSSTNKSETLSETSSSYLGLLSRLSPKPHNTSKSRLHRVQRKNGVVKTRKKESPLKSLLSISASSGARQKPDFPNRRGRMGPVPRPCPPVQHPSVSTSFQTRAAKNSTVPHINGATVLESCLKETNHIPKNDHISVILKFRGMRKQLLVRKRKLYPENGTHTAHSNRGIKRSRSRLNETEEATQLMMATGSAKDAVPYKPVNGILKSQAQHVSLNGKVITNLRRGENSGESLINGLELQQASGDITSPQNVQPNSTNSTSGPRLNSVESVRYKQVMLDWQFQLNRQRGGTDDIIFVENEVDMAEPPKDFTYICSNIYGDGVPDPNLSQVRDSLCGCQCYHLGKKCGPKAPYCCSSMADVPFAYTVAGKVCVTPGTPIYECNFKCSCPVDCVNRVVQHGRKIPLCIFRTSNNRGWGVKTLQPIKVNTFVTEYVGEVITSEEAERRGKGYDEEGETYLFDLDFDDDQMFTIDAKNYGNISHFFNHSCDPNLVVYSVWIDTLDKRLPRIAFFTTKNVSAGEELTFDYQMNLDQGRSTCTTRRKIPCQCGSKNCLQFIN